MGQTLCHQVAPAPHTDEHHLFASVAFRQLMCDALKTLVEVGC